MKINTGKGTISLFTLVSVMSLSVVVNLPGLAITPILGNLTRQFNATDLESQLVTMLPNICIIPFMLLSNPLIKRYGKPLTSIVALAIFSLVGLAFFFINDFTWIIILSCILGAACGLIIPIAASIVADLFYGKYRVKQLGMKSGIANISLVFVMIIVGFLSRGNWRLPFLVYLIPIIPLFFSKGIYNADKISEEQSSKPLLVADPVEKKAIIVSVPGKPFKMNKMRLAALMGLYFFSTYSSMVMPYYLAYDEKILKINDTWNADLTSIFYLMTFIGGAFLYKIINTLKNRTIFASFACLSIGLSLIVSDIPVWLMCVCSAILGFGNGVIQPIIYNKTAEVAQTKKNSNLALSWVMLMNYLSIAMTPIIIDAMRWFFHVPDTDNIFPFYLNAALCAIFCIWIYIDKNAFAFSTKMDNAN